MERLNEGQPRLGIEEFPAEGGLFASMPEATGLYVRDRSGWRFVSPAKGDDPRRLTWNAALDHLKDNASRTVALSELFEKWRKPPFGVKDDLSSQ